jgi:hypothetical protein
MRDLTGFWLSRLLIIDGKSVIGFLYTVDLVDVDVSGYMSFFFFLYGSTALWTLAAFSVY